MAGTSDANALLLTISADLSKLNKQFDKAAGIVDSGSKRMEKRAKDAASGIERYFGKTDAAKALDKVFDRSRLAVFDAGAARIPIFGTAVEALGPAGVAAAVGVAAITAAATQARKAMEWADDLDKTARALGTTTDSLQAFDLASVSMSIGLTEGRAALSDFNGMIGKFETHNGDVKMVKWANAIHLTRDEINAVTDPVEKFRLVMEKIATLSDVQSRTAAAKAFGLDALLPVINGGKQGIDQFIAKMRQARSEGGIVDAADIKRAAELNDRVDELTHLIGQDFHRAFIELAPAIATVAEFIERCTSNLANFIGEIPQAIRGIESLLAKIPHLPKGIKVDGGELFKSALAGTPLGPFAPVAKGLGAGLDNLAAQGRAADIIDRMKGLGHVDFTGTDLDPLLGKGNQLTFDKAGSGSGSGKKAPTDRSEQILAQLAQQQAEAQRAIVDNMLEWVKSYDPANVNQIETLIDKQREAEDRAVDAANAKSKADIISAAARGSISQDDAIEAGLIADSISIDKKLLNMKKAEEDKARASLAAEDFVQAQRREIASILASTSSLYAAMATTDAERRTIQLQALALEQKILRDAVDKDQKHDPLGQTDNKSFYDAKRQALDDNNAAQIASINKATQGPIADYLDSLGDLNKQFQTFAVDGVKSLSDALSQAVFDSKNFGASIVNVFKQLFAQILSAEIQKNLFAPILKGIGLAVIPGLAGGTDFAAGGVTLVGEEGPELVNLSRGAQVVPAGLTRKALSSMQSAPTVIERTFIVRTSETPYFDTKIEGAAQRRATEAGITSTRTSLRAAPAEMQRRASQRLG